MLKDVSQVQMRDDLLLGGMKLNFFLEEQWFLWKKKCTFSSQDPTVDNPLVKCPFSLE